MRPILVLYATREGQTRKLAEHVGATLRARGREVDVLDAAHVREPFGLGRYGAAILAASVHAGAHEGEIVAFVKRHRDALDRLPTAFLSVSLSEVTAEDETADAAARAKAHADVEQMLERFYAQTAWHPKRAKPVAGALLYTQYGFLKRLVMKRIAGSAGGPTDTSRDYEFTDWDALDRFVEELLAENEPAEAAREARPSLA